MTMNKKTLYLGLLLTIASGNALAKVTYEAALENARNLAAANPHNPSTKGFTQSEVDAAVGTQSPPIVYNGYSTSPCTNVYPPHETSITTHDINIVGTYQDQNDHARNHSYGVAQKLTTNGATRICAGFLGAGSYHFRYQITAHKK
ncbi:hypothetical protein [Aliivibrio wodanis]|uniref:hypothetical protein n=1 Tax=Aliivibrio wodanis TaxID=80852 RepID=UPI00406CA2C4